jgi:hypothetical protein
MCERQVIVQSSRATDDQWSQQIKDLCLSKSRFRKKFGELPIPWIALRFQQRIERLK